jgi:hypothetical protein
MAQSLSSFRESMFVEHIEEASALYDICLAQRCNDDLPWQAVVGFEDRIEAHVDALELGGREALEICLARAIDGDPGESFAAISTLCRRGELAALQRALRTMPPEAMPTCEAASQAFQLSWPVDWSDPFATAFKDIPPHLMPMAIRVIAGRSQVSPGLVSDGLSHADVRVQLAALDAAARHPTLPKPGQLEALCESQLAGHRVAAWLARLRRHDRVSPASLTTAAGTTSALLPLAAMAGGRAVTPQLLSALKQQPTEAAVVALGLQGDLAAVRPLLGLLEDASIGRVCAQALYVITGLAPSDVVHEVEPVASDELFDNERRAWMASGAPPLAADGQPYGTKVRRLSQDAGVWEQRLATVAGRFVRHLRYRFGHAASAEVCLKSMRVPDAPRKFRTWFYQELPIRHGIPVWSHVDAPVRAQHMALATAAAQVASSNQQPVPGQWAFAGGQVD